ncbi:MAG: hypothetical protein M3Y27_17340, partial [Acidobacteriota bacterium]|nr:hypothetical protein [Acidobacteriota bacterium]
MKRIVELLILLYPRRWRDRYETEFKGLLEDMGPRWADLHDVLKGALLMRIVVWTPLKLSFACALIGALLCLA